MAVATPRDTSARETYGRRGTVSEAARYATATLLGYSRARIAQGHLGLISLGALTPAAHYSTATATATTLLPTPLPTDPLLCTTTLPPTSTFTLSRPSLFLCPTPTHRRLPHQPGSSPTLRTLHIPSLYATRAPSASSGRAVAHGQSTTLAKRPAPAAWTGSAANHVVKRRCTSEDLTSSFLRLPAMPNEETSAAVARILSHFAKQYNPLSDGSFPASAIANGLQSTRITLPGDETVEKKTLERELTSLATRIQLLEAKASNGTASLPMTPNEPMSSAFGGDISAAPRYNGVQNRQRSQSWVNSLLAKSDGEQHQPRQLTEEQLTFLREHVERQSEEIKSQKDFIDGIKSQLNHQQAATKAVLDGYGSSISIEQLKREIEKNAQINATYQKVLKEIGTIITAVANGDLSKKVLIHAMEKDPEIAKFKHTINTMVDQLQEFAGQVTHLAKEVGTEGRLGGQAIVPGVDGIWAELTRNG